MLYLCCGALQEGAMMFVHLSQPKVYVVKIHAKHLLLVRNWFTAIWMRGCFEPKTWGLRLRLSRICDCPFILLLSKLGGSSSMLSLEPIGRLILNPRFSLVKWQQERVSVASPCEISQVLILSWIRLDQMPVGGKQKPLPAIPISNNIYPNKCIMCNLYPKYIL